MHAAFLASERVVLRTYHLQTYRLEQLWASPWLCCWMLQNLSQRAQPCGIRRVFRGAGILLQ